MEKINREEVIKWAEEFKDNFKDGVGKVKELTYADKMLTQAIEIIKDYDRLKQENKELKEYKILHEGESKAHFNCIMENADLIEELITLKTLIQELKEKLPEKNPTFICRQDAQFCKDLRSAFNQCHDQFTELLNPLFEKVEGEK